MLEPAAVAEVGAVSCSCGFRATGPEHLQRHVEFYRRGPKAEEHKEVEG